MIIPWNFRYDVWYEKTKVMLLYQILKKYWLYDCRVSSLSDCNYSLNPLNQTRID